MTATTATKTARRSMIASLLIRLRLVGWMLAVLVVMAVAFYAIPRIDPSAGIDGWGALWAMLQILAAMILATLGTIIVQHALFKPIGDAVEAKIMAALTSAGDWKQAVPPLCALVLDALRVFVIWLPAFRAMVGA